MGIDRVFLWGAAGRSSPAEEVRGVAYQPGPEPLVAYTTTFTTFGPTGIGGSTGTLTASAIQAVGDRVYVADWYQRVSPLLRVFDVSDPVTPTEVTGPGDAGWRTSLLCASMVMLH